MNYQDYADQLNRHNLIKKAKETDYRSFLDFCNSELERIPKLKLPSKIEGRRELLSMKESYAKCLQLVIYIVTTGDTKPSDQIVNRNIAKAIVEYYANEGNLPFGTSAKFY